MKIKTCGREIDLEFVGVSRKIVISQSNYPAWVVMEELNQTD